MLGDREALTVTDFKDLRYCMRCVNESMRLYPHPPVLLRRANVPDTLPGMVSSPINRPQSGGEVFTYFAELGELNWVCLLPATAA